MKYLIHESFWCGSTGNREYWKQSAAFILNYIFEIQYNTYNMPLGCTNCNFVFVLYKWQTVQTFIPIHITINERRYICIVYVKIIIIEYLLQTRKITITWNIYGWHGK